MKKSILFCCYGLGVGGIEKCMINLLNAIDTDKYDIDVLPMNPEYDLLGSLHANVRLLDPFDYVMNTTDTIAAFKEKKVGPFSYARYAMFRLVNKWGRKAWKLFKAPSKQYDIAIAYAHTGYVPYYVVDCVKAKKKYMWHHEGRYIKDNRYTLDLEYYSKLDSIIAVSSDDRQVLIDAFPMLEEKIKVIYNIIDRDEIRSKAKESVEYYQLSDVLTLTTVGRLTHQKGPDLLLEVADKLYHAGMKFRWLWVGDGDLMEYMVNEISNRNLGQYIIPVGNKKNPYPYIQLCDIYVQPSYYEAYCTTSMEAQILEKPIVVTDVCGMREQFTEGEDGLIVPIDANSIFNAIMLIIKDPQLKERLKLHLHKKMNAQDKTLESYYELFDQE